MADKTGAQLQRPSSRIGKPMQQKMASGLANAHLGQTPASITAQQLPLQMPGAGLVSRTHERKSSVSSTTSSLLAPPSKTSPGSVSNLSTTSRGPNRVQATGGEAPDAANGVPKDVASGTDLQVGDIVAIPGDKHGQLLFLGETHFAKGEWAGVYLDESCGKNNGSIDGKAYFSCPDKHGIFIKPNKLTLVHKSSSSSTASAETTDQQRPQTPMQNKSANVRRDSRVPANQTPNFKTPVASQGPNFPATSAAMRRPSAVLNGSNLDLRSSNADLNSTLTNNTPRASTPAGGSQVQLRLKPNAPPGLAPSDVKMGERVWINGIKDGTVKFIGETDFAPGVWVGVVLNDKTGKNDGCVNGKRYFQCEMGFGLFSPLSKVSKEPKRAPTTVPQQLQSQQHLSLGVGTPARPASAVLDPRMRVSQDPQAALASKRRGSASGLGMQRDKMGGSSGSISSISSASSTKFTGTISLQPTSNSSSQFSHQLQIALREAEVRENQLRQLVDKADKEKLELDRQLEEERRKVEDLHFRMEEESILKGDLLSERNKLKHRLDSTEASLVECQDQLEDLRKKYFDLEFQMAEQSLEDNDSGVSLNSGGSSQANAAVNAESVTRLEETVREKDATISCLQSELENAINKMDQLNTSLNDSKRSLDDVTAQGAEISRTAEEMRTKLTEKEASYSLIESQLNDAKTDNAKLEEQLKNQTTLVNTLKDEKVQLESTMAGFASASGDSDSQIAVLSSDLQNRKEQIDKLQSSLEVLQNEKIELLSKFESSRGEHEKELNKIKSENDEKVEELNSKCSQLTSNVSKLENDLNLAKNECDGLAHTLESKTTELGLALENLEKMKSNCGVLEEKVAKSEASRKDANEELKNVKIHLDRVTNENKILVSKLEKIEVLEKELEEVSSAKVKLEGDYSSLREKLESMTHKAETLSSKNSQLEDEIEGKDKKISELKQCVEDKIKVETELLAVKKQYDNVKSKYGEMKAANELKDSQIEALRGSLETSESNATEYKSRFETLLEDFTQLETELTDANEKIKTIPNLTEQNTRLKRNLTELNEKIAAKEASIGQYKESISKYKAELDVALKKVETLQNAGDGEVDLHIKSERDSLQNQVDFLNSVIVDLQGKNDLLTSKVEGLMGLEGNISDPDLLADDTGADSPLKGFTHNIRLFCDICDEFDLHNTEDCPIQANRPESPPATRSNGNVTEPRPYCETCEIFGHWTEECEDDQTF